MNAGDLGEHAATTTRTSENLSLLNSHSVIYTVATRGNRKCAVSNVDERATNHHHNNAANSLVIEKITHVKLRVAGGKTGAALRLSPPHHLFCQYFAVENQSAHISHISHILHKIAHISSLLAYMALILTCFSSICKVRSARMFYNGLLLCWGNG